jgi:hypothetical protein
MCAEFLAACTAAIRAADSLDELSSWLEAQPCVEFVKLENYVIKTFPPRREFTIGLRTERGAVQEKVLTIVARADGHFEFHEIRQPD